MNLELLKKLCTIYSPSGGEQNMKDFLISYVHESMDRWAVRPEIISDDSMQD